MSLPDWKIAHGYEDIRFEKADGIAKVTICRPEVRNAFRPETVRELLDAFARLRDDPEIGVVLFTGEGTEAFCSGGDQRVRGAAGYVGADGVARLNVLDLQKAIRSLQAGDRAGRGLRDRRRPRAAPGLRSHHRGRQRALRPDRPEGGQLRRRLRLVVPGARGRPEEGARDLVPVPPVRRGRGARDGAREHRRAAGRPRSDRGRVAPDPERAPARDPLPQERVQRRLRRPGRACRAGRRRDPALSTRAGRRRAATPTREARPSSRASVAPVPSQSDPTADMARGTLQRCRFSAGSQRAGNRGACSDQRQVRVARRWRWRRRALPLAQPRRCLRRAADRGNFANDLFDWGADGPTVRGPPASAVDPDPPAAMRRGVASRGRRRGRVPALVVAGGWSIALAGALALAAALAYAGRPWPLGYPAWATPACSSSSASSGSPAHTTCRQARSRRSRWQRRSPWACS